MRIAPYILYLFLIAMHEVIWRDVTSIYGVSINFTAFVVVAVAIYKSEMIALWFGFLAGLMMAAGLPHSFGLHAVILTIIGLSAYHVRRLLNLDSIYAKLLLMLAGILVHNVLRVLVDQADGFIYLLWSSVLPGAVYTAAMTWFFFALKEGLITYKKLRAIF
ncbi:MAG: rod shape-determining protein MreD [Candidatus Zixiibacteriota bacterium]|nr:MAG: rod shape-determining protein MreD [candidate division Zixibacteria bacterium]